MTNNTKNARNMEPLTEAEIASVDTVFEHLITPMGDGDFWQQLADKLGTTRIRAKQVAYLTIWSRHNLDRKIIQIFRSETCLGLALARECKDLSGLPMKQILDDASAVADAHYQRLLK